MFRPLIQVFCQPANRSRLRSLKFAAVALVGSALMAPAIGLAQQTRYWDTNGSTAGAGTTPSGTWGADAFWSSDSTGNAVTANPTTTFLDTLNFSAGTDATGAYMVTVNGNQNAKQLNIQEGIMTLSGGNVFLGTSGGINVSTGAEFFNTTVIETSGTSVFQGLGAFDNTGGTIRNNGGSLAINNTITGGDVTNVGAGTLTINGSLTGGTLTNSATGIIDSNNFGNPIISSTIFNPLGGQINFRGGFTGQTMLRLGAATHTNNGTINFNGVGGAERQLLTGDVTFNGTGSLTLATSGRFEGNAGTERLTNGVGHTINGVGILGNNLMAITNHGSIIASTGTMTIDPNAAGMINSSTGVMRANAGRTMTFQNGPLTNAGLIESLGTVNLINATIDNAGGLIRNSGGIMSISSAVTGGAVENVGAGTLTISGSLTGGTLTNSATGIIDSSSSNNPLISSTIFNPLGGQINFRGGQTGQIMLQLGAATHTNNGTINFNSAGGGERQVLTGDVAFNGTGSLSMNTSGRFEGTVGTEQLTNGAGHTINGLGILGNNKMAITNHGSIIASTGTMTIDPNAAGMINSSTGVMRANASRTLTFQNGSLTNAGLIESLGTVNLDTATVDNTGGTLRANGGLIKLSGGSVTGGSIEVSNSGTFNSQTASNSVESVTLFDGTISGSTGVLSSATFDVRNGIISGKLGGAGEMTKTTSGTVTLSNANTYSGGTVVSAGRLIVSNTTGSATGSGSVSIEDGATLSGSGRIAGETILQTGATLAAGNSAGTLNFENGLAFISGANFEWELTGNTDLGRGTNFDAVNVTGGNLYLDDGVTSTLVFNAAGSTVDWSDAFWTVDHQWVVFENAEMPIFNTEIYTFSGLTVSMDSVGNELSNGSFSWVQDGNNLSLNYSFSAVPEPSALLLVGLGIAGVSARRRRRVC